MFNKSDINILEIFMSLVINKLQFDEARLVRDF